MAEEYLISINTANILRPSDIPPAKSNGVYCRIKYSHQEYKTKVIKSSLIKPEFKEAYRLKKVKMDDDLIIELWDWESQIKSEIIGSGTFSLKGLKFKKNTPSSQDLFVKSGKVDKKTASVFFEIEYTREGIESEQEKEHKALEEHPKEEEKIEPEPPKKKRDPLPAFELPKRERKKENTKKKLLGENYSKVLADLGDFNIEFGEYEFNIDEKLKKILMEGLNEMGNTKPKNPIKFLGDYLMKFSEK